MAERSRRQPRRPILFWAMFALSVAIGAAGATSVWIKSRPAVEVSWP